MSSSPANVRTFSDKARHAGTYGFELPSSSHPGSTSPIRTLARCPTPHSQPGEAAGSSPARAGGVPRHAPPNTSITPDLCVHFCLRGACKCLHSATLFDMPTGLNDPYDDFEKNMRASGKKATGYSRAIFQIAKSAAIAGGYMKEVTAAPSKALEFVAKRTLALEMKKPSAKKLEEWKTPYQKWEDTLQNIQEGIEKERRRSLERTRGKGSKGFKSR